MAIREFVDDAGVRWQVWDVTPDQLQPRTAVEDYLGELGEGWLCFESAGERRRLASHPVDWAGFPEADLRALLARASIVPARRGATIEGGDEIRKTGG